MNNKNCIHLKQKLDRKLYCKYLKSDIKILNCSNCKYKEYNKSINNVNTIKKSPTKTHSIVKKSSKLAKLEKNRTSLFTDDLDHCIICRAKKEALHEVFFGTNRVNSMKYGCVIPLCLVCHQEMHKNKEWQDYWHRKGQLAFIESYPDLDFLQIFKKNYL